MKVGTTISSGKPEKKEGDEDGNPTHPAIIFDTDDGSNAHDACAKTQPAQPQEAMNMKLHKSILDYIEDGTADPNGPNLVHLNEGLQLSHKPRKTVPLGQTAHCTWVLTRGIPA